MRFVYMAAALVVTLLAGTWLAGESWFRQMLGFQTECSAAVAGGAIGGPFELVNAAGATVTDTDVITKPSLIYFGYTYCPDVCPMDTSRNAEAVDVLAARGLDVTPVFISVDPERDTPELVGDFAANMHEKMIGLTGSAEQIKAASNAYRTYYKAQKEGDDEYYLVDHTTFTYFVHPTRGFVDFFRRELTADQLADRVACHLGS